MRHARDMTGAIVNSGADNASPGPRRAVVPMWEFYLAANRAIEGRQPLRLAGEQVPPPPGKTQPFNQGCWTAFTTWTVGIADSVKLRALAGFFVGKTSSLKLQLSPRSSTAFRIFDTSGFLVS